MPAGWKKRKEILLISHLGLPHTLSTAGDDRSTPMQPPPNLHYTPSDAQNPRALDSAMLEVRTRQRVPAACCDHDPGVSRRSKCLIRRPESNLIMCR